MYRKGHQSPGKRIIFKAEAVSDTLEALKKAAAEDIKKDENFTWWSPALRFEWGAVRKTEKVMYVSVYFIGPDNVSGRLCVRTFNERISGNIMPATDAGVAELTGTSKYLTNIEKRNRKPSIQIQKWACQVKTAEDGITLLKDDKGQPILPGDEQLSTYHKLADLVNEAFMFETKSRIDRGMKLMLKVADMKRANKAVTAQEIEDAFVSVEGPRRPADMIITFDNKSNLCEIFPAEKDSNLLLKDAIFHSDLKITSLVQKKIGSQSKKNPGRPLPNPITRITLAFDGRSGISGNALTKFFDKDAPYTGDNKQRYEVGKVDGIPVDGDNVHQFVKSRSTVDCIVEMDSICLSNMGISMPVKAKLLVVASPPSSQELDLTDIYYEDDDSALAIPAAAGPSAIKPSLPKPDDSDNYDGLLDELGGDQAA